MKLTIIAFDTSWQFVYRVAKAMNKWDEIELMLGNHISVSTSNLTCVEYSDNKTGGDEVVIASNDPNIREREYEVRKKLLENFATLIHPHNYIDSGTQIGEGTVIGQGVIIYPNSVIAPNVIMMEYSSISHDYFVLEHTVLMEKVTTGGKGNIGKKTCIEYGTVIKEGVSIGNQALIKCGSVVLKDVLDEQSVSGNPARVIKI